MMKRSVLLSVLAASLMTLMACSDGEEGRALPTGTPAPDAATQTNPTSVPGSSSAAADGGQTPTAGLDACTLLSPEDLAQLGTFKSGDRQDLGGAHGCGWDEELASASDDPLSVAVNIRDAQGVDEVNDQGNGKQVGEVNGRRAVQTSSAGKCLIALAVGEHSRVDINTNAPDEEQACQIADYVVGIVEPKLPEG